MLISYICGSYRELPDQIKDKYSDAFFGDATVLVVEYNGKVILHKSDGCSQEESYFYRHYSWVDDAINMAYNLGLKDANDEKSDDVDYEFG